MISKKTKKVVSVLLSLMLMLSIGVTNVFAAPGDVPDTTKPVTLTVQKYLTPDTSTVPGDGVTPPIGQNVKPGAGVEFKLTQLQNVDDSTTVINCDRTQTVLTKKTDANGQIKWTATDGLTQGYWLLEEISSPYAGVAKAASSIITLPYGMKGTNGTEYNYNVTVFPKNIGDVDVNTKTVEELDNVYKPGDSVEWTIETVINSKDVVKYAIKDVLDSRLDYSSVDVSLIVPGGAPELLTQNDYDVTTNGNTITVALNASGLAKVASTQATAIRTVVKTKINMTAFTTGNGEDVIVNNAQLIFTNQGGSEETVNIEEPAVITLASLEITKVDPDGKALEGAEFKIAATEADAVAGDFLKDSNGAEVILKTGKDGKAYASGIPFTEFTPANGQIDSVTIYLVETKAPEGYALPQDLTLSGMQARVYTVTLKQGQSVTNGGVTYTKFTAGEKIVNKNIFTLPITGGAGTIIFTVIGLVLIIGAAVVLFKTRKKEAAR